MAGTLHFQGAGARLRRPPHVVIAQRRARKPPPARWNRKDGTAGPAPTRAVLEIRPVFRRERTLSSPERSSLRPHLPLVPKSSARKPTATCGPNLSQDLHPKGPRRRIDVERTLRPPILSADSGLTSAAQTYDATATQNRVRAVVDRRRDESTQKPEILQLLSTLRLASIFTLVDAPRRLVHCVYHGNGLPRVAAIGSPSVMT